MAFLAPILAIGGTLLQGVSALGQGNYQAQVARNNASIAERNANVASDQAQIKQMRSDREYAAQRGMYLAQAGASGVDPLGGSQRAVLGLIDRSRVEAGTDIRRAGEAQATNFNNESAYYRGEASAAKSAGISSLVGSVFKAGGQAAGGFGPKKRNYPASWRG